MITWIAAVSYFMMWLFIARPLYARLRDIKVGRRSCNDHGAYQYRHLKCCYDSTRASEGEAAFWAFTTALVWPVVLLVAAIRFRPPPTVAEHAERERVLQARVAELEHEAGIGDA